MAEPTVDTPAPVEKSRVPAVVGAEAEWENEGGAGSHGPAAPATPRADLLERAAESSALHGVTRLDARQDQIMEAISTDGRPPPRWMRLREWRWFWIGAAVVLVAALAAALLRGLPWQAVLAGFAAAVVLLVGASPVLVPGVLRGREERASRNAARAEGIRSRVAGAARDPSEDWTK